MEALANWIQPFFAWLVQTTLMASILIALILVAQRLLGGRLGPRWCHALWLILLIRMVLPWAPASPISLFNLIPALIPPAEPQDNRDVPTYKDHSLPAAGDAGRARTASDSTPAQAAPVRPVSGPKKQVEAQFPAQPTHPTLPQALPTLWLAGALVLGGYLLASNFALWRIVKRDHPLTNQPILELFEECKAQMGVQTIVALVPNDQVKTAALFGFLRPRLLLPREMIETVRREEMRYVFLHELAHLKRGDIYLGWLASLLQVLHWFNPLVWVAFHRMRTDRELACDALVLTRTGRNESREYGRTMVGLVEHLSRPRHLPALAGILEGKSQLKRRIAMIAQFQNNSYRWSPLAVALIVAVACLTLPNARQDIAAAAGSPASLTSATDTPQKPVFRRLQITNKIPWDVSLSSDGKNIAFVSEDKLWIMPRTGQLGPDYPGAPQVVDTGETKVDWAGLAWSRDGRWIAFNNMKEEPKGNGRMCVVAVAGGKPKEVYENYRESRNCNYRMSLSPDGKTLAFSSVDGNELHVYTLPVDGGTPTRLVEAQAREPVFSPDGKMIAYVEDKSLGRQGGSLWVVPAEGGTPKRVADAGNATSPVWSPNGRMIAFLDFKDKMMTTQIHIVPFGQDGGNAGEKTTIDFPGVDEITRLTGWTPDNQIGAVCKGHLEFGLYTLPVQGGTTTLVQHGTYACLPRWSPDGKRIIFSTDARGSGGGWTIFGTASISAEGGEVTPIPIPADTKISKPSWGAGNHVSPDGKTIVFAGKKSGDGEEKFVRGAYASHIWTLPLEGGKPTQLTNAPAPLMDWFPCWSPDGKTVAFVRAKDSPNMAEAFREANVCLIQTKGGEPRQLTSESDAFVFGAIAWSPDGRLLAYFSADKERSKDSMSLRVIPAQGGKSHMVGKVQATGFNTELAWSPDSKRIALNGRLYEKVFKIMSVDDGSTVDIIPDLVDPSSIWHLDWSRDGSRLVFAGDQGSGDPQFWVMENFLPGGKTVSGNASQRAEQRWTNSLGMVFVPVQGLDQVWFGIWETRVQDFEAFVKATGRDMGNKMMCFNRELEEGEWEGHHWRNPGFTQGPDHPVVGVNWEDATAFCKWLTEKERKEGILPVGRYRLPSDLEWSQAVGLVQESEKTDVYPWGKQWPPVTGAGNYADATAKEKYTGLPAIEGYDDGYAETAPVASFGPNPCGLYDMGGNVAEWCGYWVSSDVDEYRALRGASWFSGSQDALHSWYRVGVPPSRASSPKGRVCMAGFRVVLEQR